MKRENSTPEAESDHHGAAKWLGSLASALAAAAGAGPLALKAAVNRWLRANPDVRGHVGSVRWNPFAGRIQLGDVSLVLFENGVSGAALTIEKAVADLSWRDLLRGHLVLTLDVEHPVAQVRLRPQEGRPAEKPSVPEKKDFAAVAKALKSLPPIRLDRLTVTGGELHARNLPGQRATDVRLEKISLDLRHVQTRDWLSVHRSASLSLHAEAMGSGVITAHATADPLSPEPFFNADFQLEGLQLSELHGIILEFAQTEVTDGVFSVYVEAAGSDGAVQGYAKPVIDGLAMKRPRDAGRLRTFATRAAARLMKNGSRDRIATRINFEGPVAHPEVKTSKAVKTLLGNAFRRPVRRGLEGTASAAHVSLDVDSGRLLAPPKPLPHWMVPFRLLAETASRFSKDGCTRLGASLSYYTMFSIAPLLLLATGVAGLVFGDDAVQGRIADQLTGLMGADTAATIQSMVEAARKPSSGITATVVSVLTLGIGASAVLMQLKTSLNQIWHAAPHGGLMALLKNRLLAFSVVLAIGFLLLVSLAVSASLSAMNEIVRAYLPLPPMALETINMAASALIITMLFALLYRLLPDANVEWRDVWVGSALTTALFVIGKQLLGLYLGKGATASAYGAAGSVLVLLVWVYYSAQIFYFGAEFTKVYADWYGSASRRDPREHHSGR